jgi:hypothetical protein
MKYLYRFFIFGSSSKCFTRQASRTHDDSKRMRETLLFNPPWFCELNQNRGLEEKFAIIFLLASCFRIWKRDPCASLHALLGKKTATESIECRTVRYSNAQLLSWSLRFWRQYLLLPCRAHNSENHSLNIQRHDYPQPHSDMVCAPLHSGIHSRQILFCYTFLTPLYFAVLSGQSEGTLFPPFRKTGQVKNRLFVSKMVWVRISTWPENVREIRVMAPCILTLDTGRST